MDAATRVNELITPTLADMGYEVVRVRFGGKPAVLQIMAERVRDGGMDIDDCEAVSRAVSAIMDVEDPIPSAYNLEVSSPGIDRPLTRLKDFARWAGHEARIELNAPQDGRKRFKGLLMGLDGEAISLVVDGQSLTVPFAAIRDAKLVLTDALLAAARAAEAAETQPID